MHLSIYMSKCLSHSEVQGRYLTLSRVFITSSCFRFISLNCTFLEKSLYCDFLLLLRSPRSPTIAFLLALCFLRPSSSFLPPARGLATLVHRPSTPSKAQLPSFTSPCAFSPLTLTQTADPQRPPPPSLSHDPLTSSCFSC